MAGPSSPPPPLLYLDAAAVETAMPPLPERLRLAEQTMTALIADAQMPPKIAVHPRPAGSFAHAMPAWLGATNEAAGTGDGDLLGIKWVSGFPANGARGLPAIHATVILDQATTGLPLAILDGAPITAQRTAAVSGVAIRHWAPAARGPVVRAAIVGAGVQARSQVTVLGALLPGVHVSLFDRHPERAAAVAALAAATPGIAAAEVAASARAAVAAADVVITAASFGPQRQTMGLDWFRPWALVVPIDYDTCCAAAVAREADLFLVDDRAQFLATRAADRFADYPDPGLTFGEAIRAETPRPGGRVVATHLGVGLADVIFGAAIVARARDLGLGQVLPR
jgi:ornithine cyclodeaminase/alanine dehydrogenase-like protein (mu-crystallin family)